MLWKLVSPGLRPHFVVLLLPPSFTQAQPLPGTVPTISRSCVRLHLGPVAPPQSEQPEKPYIPYFRVHLALNWPEAGRLRMRAPHPGNGPGALFFQRAGAARLSGVSVTAGRQLGHLPGGSKLAHPARRLSCALEESWLDRFRWKEKSLAALEVTIKSHFCQVMDSTQELPTITFPYPCSLGSLMPRV